MNTLLLIEDDHRLAHMVGEYLRQSGFEVQHAANGLTGLRLLQEADSRGEPTSLVLLDLMLPDIDGLDVCRRIRGLPGHLAQTPVLMLTAKGDPMDRIVGLEIGADDYLPKPFEPRELLARIRAVLRRHRPQRFTRRCARVGASTAQIRLAGARPRCALGDGARPSLRTHVLPI
jgi:DNA-binding response OmpR family regulator